MLTCIIELIQKMLGISNEEAIDFFVKWLTMSMAKEVEIHVRINAIVTWSSGFWVIAAPLNVGIQCIQKNEKHLVLWNHARVEPRTLTLQMEDSFYYYCIPL